MSENRTLIEWRALKDIFSGAASYFIGRNERHSLDCISKCFCGNLLSEANLSRNAR